ncbi:MAG: ubiquinone/menaquinone biosynthesis methyltransferase [Promethearchaeota archaeon]
MSKGVRKIFSEVSGTYELVNHILTLGMDILWRRKATRIAVQRGGSKWLEVCSGTSETASYLQEQAEKGVLIVASDFSLPMIQIASKKQNAKRIALTLAESKTLPFADDTFDLVIISFATRNINSTRAKLTDFFREFRRVLKPGGRFINLETSQPSSSLIRKLYHLYVRIAIRPIGQLVSGSKTGYAYLSYTIPRFYNPNDLAEIIRDAGFSTVDWKQMFLGVAAIHEAVK